MTDEEMQERSDYYGWAAYWEALLTQHETDATAPDENPRPCELCDDTGSVPVSTSDQGIEYDPCPNDCHWSN